MHILGKWLVENMQLFQLLAAYCDATLVGSVYLSSILSASAKALQVRARPMVVLRL